MFKNLVASCLCALSVNLSPLPYMALDNATIIPNSYYSITIDNNSSHDLDNSLFTGSYVGDDFIGCYLYNFYSSNILVSLRGNVPSKDIINNSVYFYWYGFEDNQITFSYADLSDEGYFTFSQSGVNYSFTFILYFPSDTNAEVFNTEYLPYISKLESPSPSPSRNNLYRLLYDFYYSLFSDDDLAEISTGYNMPFDNWLAHTCTIVTLLVLVFVCFLFLKWLFKVISGLILLKH